MLAMLTAAVTQVAMQALPSPVNIRPHWLGSLATRLLTVSWFAVILALLLVALAFGLFGLSANGWNW